MGNILILTRALMLWPSLTILRYGRLEFLAKFPVDRGSQFLG